MEKIIKVFDCNGTQILYDTVLSSSSLNQIYNKLYILYLHCHKIELLCNNKKFLPIHKISDICTETDTEIVTDTGTGTGTGTETIILNIVVYLKSDLHQSDYCIAINTDGNIIDCPLLEQTQRFKYLKHYLNSKYNCLNIISICSNNKFVVVLFDNGQAIKLSYENKEIKLLNIFHNVTKIVSTGCTIGIIINDIDLITSDDSNYIKSLDISSLNYKYIYTDVNFFFIINQDFITIVYRQIFCPNEKQIVVTYPISNINKIYCYCTDIAAIREDNSVISFNIDISRNELSEKILNIKPYDDINKEYYKIKKILHIGEFIALTYDDTVIIWGGHNPELIELYHAIKNNLTNVEDIVIAEEYIGILKKDNSIIVISLISNIYAIYKTQYKYVDIISTDFIIFGFTDDNKVYGIPKPEHSWLPIEIGTNIKEVYANRVDILAISHDNIIYVYKYENYDTTGLISYTLYYEKQILDLKSIRVEYNSFIIIKNNGELIGIQYENNNDKIFKDVVKFINFD